MGQMTVEYVDVEVRGRVVGVSRDKKEPKTWCRFKAADGQLAVVIPDVVMPVPLVQVGDDVVIACIPSVSNFGVRLTAGSVQRSGGVPQKKE